MATTRQHGVVLRFMPEKKFGFLKPDGGAVADCFFHLDAWGASSPPSPGQRVSFLLKSGPKGWRAEAIEDDEVLDYGDDEADGNNSGVRA
jgi:cold shock CspA family protein